MSDLQDTLYENRAEVLTNPFATENVHGIAAFASLHVSIVFTAALVAHLTRLPKTVRWIMWIYTALTMLATVYFGWHYVLDVIAGFALGGLSVWLASKAVGTGRKHFAPRIELADPDVGPGLVQPDPGPVHPDPGPVHPDPGPVQPNAAPGAGPAQPDAEPELSSLR